jgi:hypothetical protein
MSEVGTDMSPWPTEKHFTSWLKTAENNSQMSVYALEAFYQLAEDGADAVKFR